MLKEILQILLAVHKVNFKNFSLATNTSYMSLNAL